PAGCRLPTHRVLGGAEGLPPIDSFELALYYRDGAPAATLALAQRLTVFCGLK
ncbi:TPA: LysR family transcriptional regulator, partial [Serratia marcescens]|nr:LysR family transcriptional regulator [Serratia marcescens]